MNEKPQLLLIDDGTTYAEAMTEHMPEFALLPVEGNRLRAPNGLVALKYLRAHANRVDAILLDMRFDVDDEDLLPLPEAKSERNRRRYQGVAILRRLRSEYPDLPVVVLTSIADLSLGDVATELESLSLTYMLEGDGLDALRIRIHSALRESARSPEENDILWGRDSCVRRLRRRMAVLASGKLPVILEGETGTGKSYLAEKFIHVKSGRSGPFVTLDLSTVPTDLVAAHLFGAVRGAYTGAVDDRQGVFEMAHNGTLFIDEIQNIPLEVQKQLLLVLQNQRIRPLGGRREVAVDVKVIAGSNQSLAQCVREGQFRPDLYMRLSPATRVRLPPLRERMADFDFLIRRFADRSAEASDVKGLRARMANALGHDRRLRLILPDDRHSPRDSSLNLIVPQPAWRRLKRHSWPGNLRELSMVVHNLVIFTLVAAVDALESGVSLSSNTLQIDAGLVHELLGALDDLPSNLDAQSSDPNIFPIRLTAQDSLNSVSVAVERQYFEALFKQLDGDIDAMAERLLGDPSRARAIRLRFNQLGLKIRELRRE